MKLFTCLLVLISLLPIHTQANSTSIPGLPKLLEPWTDWVLHDTPNHNCPFFYNNHKQQYCAWPSTLTIEFSHHHGRFSSYWQVYSDSYLTLPGNNQHWPQNVTVNNKPALVIERNNTPTIKLNAGAYTIQGDFFWNNIPDSLSIPPDSGIITVKVLDKRVLDPEIKNNQLWLTANDTGKIKPKDKTNQINLQVFRKIDDGIPLQLTTHLSLEISGMQREIKIPHALLSDFIPVSLNSPLPTRLETDGTLLVQVRPGRWAIELLARNPKQLTDLHLAINNPNWPDSEIWSFAAQAQQRVVEIEKVAAIDPSQTNIPAQWKSLPAFLLRQGDTMHFKVIRRGDPDPAPNNLSLKRQLWLDFAGTGYTAQDKISGSMTHGWRLDSLNKTQLGHVELNGDTLLITQSINGETQGVEVRKGRIDLTAESRIEDNISSLSTTGWQQKFNQLSATLHLPPGWHLLAVTGIDNVPNSWVTRWTLLDLFLVLITALAIARLWNNYWGLFALITLALIWHESDAPRFVWLNILAAIALIRVLPQGKLLKIVQYYRSLCSLALVIICIPFLVNQIRTGLYPQLEKPWQHTNNQQYSATDSIVFDIPTLEENLNEGLAASKTSGKMQSPTPKSSYSLASIPKFNRIDPNANLQTGPGLPQWQWTSIPLSWNGSVDGQQNIRLWYLNPTTSLLLNFLRAIVVIILTFLMLGIINKRFIFKLPKQIIPLCFMMYCILPLSLAYADYPSPELLNELKQRLLKAPDCLPNCAQISTLQLDIDNKTLSMTLEIHAQESVATPLPVQYKQWLPNSILVNGVPATAIIRDQEGLLWLNLERGIHQVILAGYAPVSANFTLPLPLKPQRITHKIQHWSIEGLRKNDTAENQLHFTRLANDSDKKNELPSASQGNFPAFINIERILHLGLDWHITTRVNRLAKQTTAATLKVPLLNGESISSPNIQSQNGYAIIHLTPNDHQIEWQSLLGKNSSFTLKAPETDLWTEIWQLNISPIWHINSDGIAPIHHQNHAKNWLPTWRPWPGESLRLSISRPKAIPGQTLTIDKSVLQITSGKRNQETHLKLDIRSSKGTQHSLQLPSNAQLESISLNGKAQPIRQQEQTVTLPIKPGKQHYELNWHNTTPQSSVLTTPALNLGITSVNSHLKVLLGQDRWVLLTTGPQFGPAVLFWGVLIVLALLATALGKSDITPLKHWQWFLLLLGLSQIPIITAFVVIAWLMALGFRKKLNNDNVNIFNLIQIILVLLTLASLAILFITVEQGLLGTPAMQIIGNQSTAFQLNWYQDRNSAVLATATVISVPLTSYRILMLLWSLWLAISLLNWLKWGWQCFSYQGLWKKSVSQSIKDET